MELIGRDPFRGVRYVSHDTREPILSAEHRTLVERCRDENFRDMLAFLWETGLRPDELVRLEWANIRSDLLSFRNHKTKRKTGCNREVPITAPMREILARAKQRNPHGTVVFLTLTGRSLRD